MKAIAFTDGCAQSLDEFNRDLKDHQEPRVQEHQVIERVLAIESLVGDMEWLERITGWTHDKISRLCRKRQIKGAFQAQPGSRGSMWNFRKAKTLAWLESLEV